ncbi:MAG: ABC-type transport auxiliary lipoprotein family protein [Alphaproteobacteria bacterium]
MKLNAFIIAAFSTLLLSGCSGLKSSAPPPDIYMLHAAPLEETGAAARALRVLAIPEPEVPAGFEADKIVIYLQQERRMDYAAHANWSGPLPKVLQQFIVQTASNTPGLMGVTPESGVPAASRLLVRVNDFEPVYESGVKAAPLLKVSLTFTSISQQEKVGTSFTLVKTQAATANSLTAITNGLEVLARELTAEALWKMKFSPRQPRPTPD